VEDPKYMVAVVGAGPAGLYAARKLIEGGSRVVLLNRDIKPGGLAEYGIYWDKYKMKQGLRNQFRQNPGPPLDRLLWQCDRLLWRKHHTRGPA